jgi:hypothetical protein
MVARGRAVSPPLEAFMLFREDGDMSARETLPDERRSVAGRVESHAPT